MSEYCVGIDLGGTYIKFGTMDRDQRVGPISQHATPRQGGAEAVFDVMADGVEAMLADAGVPKDAVVGVGIGSPGPLSISEGRIVSLPNLPGLDNAPIRDAVGQRVGKPAVLENDANAAAYGEYICGAGQGSRDMILLTLGTGLGGGIIQDGKILHGAHEIGAEIGHMIVEPGGELCGCGQKGCLERYCSATFIGQYADRLVREMGRPSSLKTALDERGKITAKDVVEARRQGDELAEEVWQRGMYFLALGCVNICRIFDPDEIVIAGGLTKAGRDLLEPLSKHFRQLHWSLTEPKTRIVVAKLGPDAGAIGAAGVAWQNFGER